MKSTDFSEIIRYASYASIALPLLAYLVRFRVASRPIHLIGVIAIVSVISDTLAFRSFAQGTSTILLFNTYYVILFALLAWFYFDILTQKSERTVVIGGLLIYVVSFALITTFLQPFSVYQNHVWTIIALIMVVFSTCYVLHIFSLRTPMSNNALLWINSGILYYFTLNLFLFVMSSYVLTKLEPQISNLIWSFHNVNNVLKNILIGFGIFAFTPSRASQASSL
jgi:hypothetical protein